MRDSRKMWIPDIVYEEGSKIPMVQVPVDKVMPEVIHIYEYRMTGEYSPGPAGEDIPKCDVHIHQYIDQEVLREVLDEETLNRVRAHCGLEPLKDAKAKGERITSNVKANVDALNQEENQEVH